MLRCKHHICRVHAEKLAKDSARKSISCPVCKVLTFQNNEDVLRVNHNLQVVADRWQEERQRSVRSNGALEITCGVCEDAHATKRCVQCDGLLCDACLESSHGKGFFKNHTIVDLSDGRGPEGAHCILHPEEKVGFFCSDCCVVVCSHCILLGDHMNHNTMPLARACEEQRDHLRNQVERLQARKKGNEELLLDLRGLELKVLDGGRQQRDVISELLAQLKEVIEAKRQKLLKQSMVEQDMKQNQIKAQMDKTQDSLDAVEKLLSRSEEMLRVDSEYSFLTIVLPLIQDGIRISSKPVEPMTQVQTAFRTLSVDVQVKSVNELDFNARPQANAYPQSVLPVASARTIGGSARSAFTPAQNKAPASPGPDSTQGKARVLTVANSPTLAKKSAEHATAQVVRVYRSSVGVDK